MRARKQLVGEPAGGRLLEKQPDYLYGSTARYQKHLRLILYGVSRGVTGYLEIYCGD